MGAADLRHRVSSFMQRFSATHAPKDPMEQEIDCIISKKIMEHLNEFFKGAKINGAKMQLPQTATVKRSNERVSKTKTVKKKL
jgi:hypothetical protein